MDGSAYLDPQDWDEMLRHMQVSEVQIRDMRYDGVIHLVTAADGAEKYYNLANNQARHESLTDAIQRDRKTQVCPHP